MRQTSACASVQFDQSLCCTHEEILHLWLSKMRPVEILMSAHKWYRSACAFTQADLNLLCELMSMGTISDVADPIIADSPTILGCITSTCHCCRQEEVQKHNTQLLKHQAKCVADNILFFSFFFFFFFFFLSFYVQILHIKMLWLVFYENSDQPVYLHNLIRVFAGDTLRVENVPMHLQTESDEWPIRENKTILFKIYYAGET